MKKILLLLIGLTLIGLVPSASANWEGTITIWDGPRWPDEHDNRFHWIEGRIAEFEELNPGIEIELVKVPWVEFDEKLAIAIAGRVWPDIASVGLNLRYIEMDVVEALDDFFSEEELADFFPAALEEFTHKGSLWGIPTTMSVLSLMLNLDIFEERGVEPPVDGRWTWDEFVNTMKKLTFDRDEDGQIDVYGFSTYIRRGYFEAWPFLLMDGAMPLSPDGKEYTFDSPEAISALEKFVSLRLKYQVAPPEFGSIDIGSTWMAFANPELRTVAVQPWANWAIAALRDREEFKTNFMVAEYPIGNLGRPITLGGAGGFTVFRQKCRDKLNLVVEFGKFLAETEQQYLTAIHHGTFPARRSAKDMDPFHDKPQMRRAAEMLKYVVTFPRHPNWSKIEEKIQAQLQLAVTGDISPEEALVTAGKLSRRFFR